MLTFQEQGDESADARGTNPVCHNVDAIRGFTALGPSALLGAVKQLSLRPHGKASRSSHDCVDHLQPVEFAHVQCHQVGLTHAGLPQSEYERPA
jgi:hypothetical protein